MLDISARDRERLRTLAGQQAELAAKPGMAELKKLWYAHCDCMRVRPMVVIETGTFQQEMIPPLMQCEGEEARKIEHRLLMNTFNHLYFGDDTVVEDFMPVGTGGWLQLFNHKDEVVMATDENGRQTVGHRFVYVVKDLEEDFDKFAPSAWGWDREGAQKTFDTYQELFGDILPPRWAGANMYSTPTQKLVHMMGMEQMFYSMCDDPERFEKVMGRIADDTIAYYRFLEENHLILPTRDFEWLGQGTYCCTRRLPGLEDKPREDFRVSDIWGFMDSQETVGISPDMFGELVFPCYQKISSQFGALSYGCCEPVHGIWDEYLSTLPNLRRVSISAWCDEEFMGERLRGRDIVYHRKPPATFLGVGTTLDEDAVRASIRHTVECARGCEVEFTQRDVYTVNNDIPKVRRYVEIIREESEKHKY